MRFTIWLPATKYTAKQSADAKEKNQHDARIAHHRGRDFAHAWRLAEEEERQQQDQGRIEKKNQPAETRPHVLQANEIKQTCHIEADEAEARHCPPIPRRQARLGASQRNR